MATFPLSTLAPVISSTGITAPTYADILTSLQTSFRLIYGADAYLEPDSQDGQLLAIFAQAMMDSNQATIAAYNNWSPVTAQGAGLSSVVKVNGIARRVESRSSVDLLVIGTVGTVIVNGRAQDTSSNFWNLPASVTIPGGGSITVTASAAKLGAIFTGLSTINTIATPTAGWESVNNIGAVAVGAPVETDAELRVRQTASTALNSLTVLEAVYAAIAALPGVTKLKVYENDTASTDARGMPAHSIAAVVIGGDSDDIAAAIASKKTPGAFTHGTTTVSVTDAIGISRTIRFFIPVAQVTAINITIVALTGYVSATGTALRQALADYVNGLDIGAGIFLSRLYPPALLNGGAAAAQYQVSILQVGLFGGAITAADLAILYNQRVTLTTANVTLTVI